MSKFWSFRINQHLPQPYTPTYFDPSTHRFKKAVGIDHLFNFRKPPTLNHNCMRWIRGSDQDPAPGQGPTGTEMTKLSDRATMLETLSNRTLWNHLWRNWVLQVWYIKCRMEILYAFITCICMWLYFFSRYQFHLNPFFHVYWSQIRSLLTFNLSLYHWASSTIQTNKYN